MNTTVRARASRFAGALLLFACACAAQAAGLDAATRDALRIAARAAAAAPRPPHIPRAAFLREPAVGELRLAPDGLRLSVVLRAADRSELWLQSVATGARTRVLPDARGVAQAWSGDGRRLWLADALGLAVVDGRPATARRILRWDRARGQRFLGADARAPAFALVHERVVREGRTRHRYLRVDAAGRTQLLHEAALPLRTLVLDPGGRLAMAAGFEGPAWDTVVRRHAGATSRVLARCVGTLACVPVGLDARGAVWMLSQQGGDLHELRRQEPGATAWRSVLRDPAGIADADTLLWDPLRATWRALAFHGARRAWVGNDAGTRATLAALARRLPGANLQLEASADGTAWLVRAQSATWPADRHYLFHVRGARLQPLFATEASAVAAGQPPSPHLAPAVPVSWRASDGMRLHGYLYLPRGLPAARAPLLAWLHGGPFARLVDEYDPRVQLLVNRGHAVFVPNFRGSTGYGLRNMRAANGDVGKGRVLADIVEGMDALLAAGIGDAKRQAVLGHSFGGYASLLAVSHHPRRFAFAFAGAAPTDYGWTKHWQVHNESTALRGDGPPVALAFAQHGLPWSDPAWRLRMQRESPLATLAALRAPVTLWAGALDDRTPLKSLVHYASEARRHGKAVSLLADAGAGHVPDGPLGADAYLYLMERAADRAFGGGLSPPSPALVDFVRKHQRIDVRAARAADVGAASR
jgi:dipeptidyl aminopeptidase/acylaminoacyl peptidase